MDEGILMGKQELKDYETIERFINGKIKRREAANVMNVTERTVTRKGKKVQALGVLGVMHGNRGKEPWNKGQENDLAAIVELVREKYFDFNMTHCLERLRESHNVKISYASFRRLCHKENVDRQRLCLPVIVQRFCHLPE